MTTRHNRKISLDDVLEEITALPAPPDGEQLRALITRYPQFKTAIVDFATDWVEMEATRSAYEVKKEDVDVVVDRTMSRVQQVLDEATRSSSVNDLLADIKAAGHDLESFQRAVGIDRSMLTCLAERMIRPSTIPLRLVTSMAKALGRAAEVMRDYLQLPPQPAAAFKARKRPEPKQDDFAVVVKSADLTEPQKARWLTEPPDPSLRARSPARKASTRRRARCPSSPASCPRPRE
jgi:hypothetical protein